jgi:hypothetical protein
MVACSSLCATVRQLHAISAKRIGTCFMKRQWDRILFSVPSIRSYPQGEPLDGRCGSTDRRGWGHFRICSWRCRYIRTTFTMVSRWPIDAAGTDVLTLPLFRDDQSMLPRNYIQNVPSHTRVCAFNARAWRATPCRAVGGLDEIYEALAARNGPRKSESGVGALAGPGVGPRVT